MESQRKRHNMSNELNDVIEPLQLIHMDSFGSGYIMSASKEKVECSSDDR